MLQQKCVLKLQENFYGRGRAVLIWNVQFQYGFQQHSENLLAQCFGYTPALMQVADALDGCELRHAVWFSSNLVRDPPAQCSQLGGPDSRLYI